MKSAAYKNSTLRGFTNKEIYPSLQMYQLARFVMYINNSESIFPPFYFSHFWSCSVWEQKTSEDLAEFFWEQLFLGHSSKLDQRSRMWICPSSAQVSGWIFTPSSPRAGAAWSVHQKNDLLKKTQLRLQWMSYCMLTGKTVWCVEWCFSNLSITKTILTQFALKINLSIEK